MLYEQFNMNGCDLTRDIDYKKERIQQTKQKIEESRSGGWREYLVVRREDLDRRKTAVLCCAPAGKGGEPSIRTGLREGGLDWPMLD